MNTEALAELRVELSQKEREGLQEKYVSITQRKLVEKKLLKQKKEQQRRKQMQGAFRINSKLKIQNSKILLVDDVWTSGATMLECAKVLKRGGAVTVWGLTFARSGW